MSITCSPDRTPLTPNHRGRPAGPPRALADLVRLGVVPALVVALAVLGGHVLEARSAARLDAAMFAPVQALLPGGRLGAVDVADDPALLAEYRGVVRRTTATVRSRDGHPTHLVVRDYDRTTGVAQSVSWQIERFPMPSGWRPVSTANPYLSQAEREIDGHQVRVTATAALRGDRLLVAPAGLTVDGAVTTPLDAPPAVRAAVDPILTLREIAVPMPDVGATVRHAWFEDGAMGVELRATQVPVRTAGTGAASGR